MKFNLTTKQSSKISITPQLQNAIKLLQYSAIETPTPIQHHLATMQILSIDESHCKLEWTTEIEPEAFAKAVHEGMLISIEGLKKIIK